MDDIYGKDRYSKYITIKTACFRKVDSELMNFRKNIARNRQLEFNHSKHDIPDPRDCFEDKSQDYEKADALIKKLHLTKLELDTLNCYISGMRRAEVAAELGITVHGVRYRKLRIRQKYAMYIGVNAISLLLIVHKLNNYLNFSRLFYAKNNLKLLIFTFYWGWLPVRLLDLKRKATLKKA